MDATLHSIDGRAQANGSARDVCRFRARRRAAGRQPDRRGGAGVDALLPRLRGADGALRRRRAGGRSVQRRCSSTRCSSARRGGRWWCRSRRWTGWRSAIPAPPRLIFLFNIGAVRDDAGQRDAERGRRGLEPVGAGRLLRPGDAARRARPGGGSGADRACTRLLFRPPGRTRRAHTLAIKFRSGNIAPGAKLVPRRVSGGRLRLLVPGRRELGAVVLLLHAQSRGPVGSRPRSRGSSSGGS